jgi:hypothetical protein
VWDRDGEITGFLDANKRPMRVHEDVLVFGKTMPTYFPRRCGPRILQTQVSRHLSGEMYSKMKSSPALGTRRALLDDVIRCKPEHAVQRDHPTGKPASLMRTLVEAFTDEGGTVLDPFMGAGSTGVGCALCDRSFIGIESDATYHARADRRIREARPLFTQEGVANAT